MARVDKNSFSNCDEVVTTHFHLDWTVDFDVSAIKGVATITMKAAKEGVKQIVLDSNEMAVDAVKVDEVEAQFEMGAHSEALGNPLVVSLSAPLQKGAEVKVAVTYHTGKKAGAIQFLSPEQTAGKKHPYMFTQCEAIHARSLFPCQDTPRVKATYTAAVIVPDQLVALMSAVPKGEPVKVENGRRFEFEQKVPIPAYLTAIAVGDLVGKKVGERSTVYSEPSMIEACVYEFGETEKMLEIAEDIAGPYVWGVYGVLVLPPSFPFGGMENPCLTFVTPTLLAGDRSLADVVAHEISHSWSGNLVTNASWENFWLNEGFTMYLERAIKKRMEGKDEYNLSCVIGQFHLKEELERYGYDHDFTKLTPDLTDKDPDDAFSSVPYEKGFSFLIYLESVVGEEGFLRFLKAYFSHFAYASISVDDMKAFFCSFFADVEEVKQVEWDKWLTTAGEPAVVPKFEETLLNEAKALAEQLANGSMPESNVMKEWSSSKKVVMLDALVECNALSPAQLEQMDTLFDLTSVRNAEVRFRWLKVCLKGGWEEAMPRTEAFLAEQGRMKFVRPLFTALSKSPIQGAKERAVEVFNQLRNGYHNIASKMIARDLSVSP